MVYIVPIVSGHGEVKAVPTLLYRVAGMGSALRVHEPVFRVHENKFINDFKYFNDRFEAAAIRAAMNQGMILIILDCEDDCPAVIGPKLRQWAKTARSDVTVLVVLAYREFETWFVTAAKSLAGHFSWPRNVEPPPDPERIRGAKEWLSRHMGETYVEVTHQLDFTRRFDLDQARSNPSFDRFYRRIHDFLTHAQ